MYKNEIQNHSIPDFYDSGFIRKFSYLQAGLTVEASLVMPVVLLSLVLMLSLGFRTHDRVFSNLAVNEAVELYGHMAVQNAAVIEQYAKERLMHTLQDGSYGISLEKLHDGSKAILRTEEDVRMLEDRRIRPESVMRAVTLTEEIKK